MMSVASATADTPSGHRVAVQINSSDPALMNLALNNIHNIVEYYKGIGEEVQIEVVAYGPGLHMLRADTSPVKERLTTLKQSQPTLAFSACENTRNGMKRAERKDIPLLPEAGVVPSGVVRLMQLQEQGWSYLRP